ncbi:hypothetical protein FHU41_001882 [Psychromicrobium silvestre]|uniref:Uncharacterized protein n=1 Tax=Psychromicrobium silvestre TaxID=1645614 RepID=A0A7Y9S8S1_9MICC|nr:hypothetical protein [Psychromicrobium silvestre]NYE95632.1 hypothetical protein [Psychromicrobium silvestre]
MSETPQSEDAPLEKPHDQVEVSVRSAPKYVPFLIAGGVLGIIGAGIFALLPEDNQYDKGTIFGFFVVLFALVGVGLGGILALILDLVGRRRAQRGIAEETSEQPTEEN